MPDVKATNPKDAIGSSKLPIHMWPTTATMMGSIGLLNGALKYGRTNWREAGVRCSIYYDAILRHMMAWWEGEEVDPDDGVPHLAAVLASAAILVDAKAQGMLRDDRGYNGAGYRTLSNELTAHVARLKQLHDAHDPKHWTAADNATETCDFFLNLTGRTEDDGTQTDLMLCTLTKNHDGDCLFKGPQWLRDEFDGPRLREDETRDG